MTTHLDDHNLARKVSREEFVTRVFRVAGIGVVVLVLAGLVYNNISTRDVLEEVRSCTTPGGECYQRGQESTVKAVGDINRIVVYAAACADRRGVNTEQEIQACVLKLLEEDTDR